MRQDTTRIVLYSHDALGLGHLRRNLALAHRLAHDLPHLTGASVKLCFPKFARQK